jgi:hypothetical protein
MKLYINRLSHYTSTNTCKDAASAFIQLDIDQVTYAKFTSDIYIEQVRIRIPISNLQPTQIARLSNDF